MIKPLNTTQLSSAKPRCGLQSISELLPRLIRQYELQAEAAKVIQSSSTPVVVPALGESVSHQSTFSWYDEAGV